MEQIIVLSKKDTYPNEYVAIDTTSRNQNVILKRGLSPFFLGPVSCYDKLMSFNMENAWQFSKVYHKFLGEDGEPNKEYYKWRDFGYQMEFADRYPMGRGAVPVFSWWKCGDNYKKLSYIESRKQIYIPLYAKAVVKTEAFAYLWEKKMKEEQIALLDFDGYNYQQLGMNLKDVVNAKSHKMGHAFVLKMLLDEVITITDGNVVDNIGILE